MNGTTKKQRAIQLAIIALQEADAMLTKEQYRLAKECDIYEADPDDYSVIAEVERRDKVAKAVDFRCVAAVTLVDNALAGNPSN